MAYSPDNSAGCHILRGTDLSITIRRGALPSDNFTIIANAWLRDDRLPWAARGLLSWIASHADDFRITEDSIIAAGPGGRAQVRSMTRALEEAGYLKRERQAIVTGGSAVTYCLTDPRGGENRPLGNDGKPPLRADQGEQPTGEDVPAGQAGGAPRGRFSPPRSTEEDQEKNKETSSPSRAPRSDRGTRIPEDFSPDGKMREWYVSEGLERAGLNGKLEHQKFMNYWLSKPGAAGRKTDWRRTWMNWMLSAAERLPVRPVSAIPGSSVVVHAAASQLGISTTSSTNNKVLQGLALAEKFRKMEENQ